MDPDAALREFIEALAEAENATEGTDEREDALSTAASRAEGLFDWLAGGGFPPDWQRLPEYREHA